MLKKSSNKQGFIEGSAILLSATVLVKILGAVFKIPLNNMLGEFGVGYFTTAYDLYSPLYSVATAGIPVAISKMIAQAVENKKYNDINQIFKISKKLFALIGLVGTAVLALLAFPFVRFTSNGDTNLLYPVLFVAPGFAVCAVISVYRGYYEGLHNMRPTAVSNIIEGTGKLVLGLTLSYSVLVIREDKTMKTLALSSAAAIFGIVLSSALGVVYLVVKSKKSPLEFSENELAEFGEPANKKQLKQTLIQIAVPVVLCSLLTNITSLIDVFTVKPNLTAAIKQNPEYFKNCYSELIAKNISADPNFSIWNLPTALYGCHRSYAYSIYNLVPMLTASLGVGLIPVLTAAWEKGEKSSIKRNLETMLKISALITLPAGFGIIVLAKPILNLLYSNNQVAVEIAAKNLKILGICAVFSGLTVPILSMLQAIGKQKLPLYNIFVGALLKTAVNYILVSNSKYNILGVPIGTTVCYVYIAISNYICLVKCSKVKINVYKTLLKPLLAAAVCGGFAGLFYNFVGALFTKEKLLTLITVMFSVIVYIASVYFLKILDKNDKFYCSKE